MNGAKIGEKREETTKGSNDGMWLSLDEKTRTKNQETKRNLQFPSTQFSFD